MQKHILKKALKMSVVVLLLALSFPVIGTVAHAAILSPQINRTNTQATANCLFHDIEIYMVVYVEADAYCIQGVPDYFEGYAASYGPPGGCNAVASITSTIWGYYSDSYHILARETSNSPCSANVGEQVRVQCGVIYHAESEVTRWWWAGPPWDAVANTASFNFC